jgi:sortase A
VAIAAVAIVLPTSGGATPPPDGVTVTATSPTTNLVDGQRVTINVKADADVALTQLQMKQCRLGATYEVRDDIQPFSGKCPSAGVSSSADAVQVRDQEGFFTLAKTSAGLTISFKVGVGATSWPVTGGNAELRCDPANPCALVLRLQVGSAYHYSVTPLSFVDADPVAGCGGPATGSLASSGSDEMADAWASWTRDFCATNTAVEGAPTGASFGPEGEYLDGAPEGAVSKFAAGELDIAYTASGYTDEVGLGPADPTTRRAAIAVPIAINASVVAAGGGFIQYIEGQPIGKAPYPTLELTPAEASALVSGGIYWADRDDQPYRSAIIGRNPELAQLMYYSGGSVDTAGVYASSLPLSSTYFLTDYLSKTSPDDFAVPFSNPKTMRPATANLALADPSYASALKLVSGRPPLSKATDAATLDQNVGGPVWVVTDRATARALGITPVALGTEADGFVAPTAETMDAAVSTMQKNAEGFLVPDFEASAEVNATAEAAYPLTYVEYAMVPAEPLVDESCAPRSQSQALLTSWLEYLVGNGQDQLPEGFEPLPQALVSEAKVAIQKVGASPTTVCGTSTGAGGAPASAASLPLSSLPLGTPGAVTPGALPASTADAAKAKTKLAAVPVFSRIALPDANDGVVALVGIILVTALGVYITAQQTAGGTALAGAGAGAGAAGAGTATGAAPRRRLPWLIALWSAIAIAGFGLVLYPLEGLFQQQDQRALFRDYREEVRRAANADQGLQRAGDDAGLKPPEVGAPVGVLEVGALESQQVVVEGISPEETAKGPGHVPGTAGLGQPGNSVVVGRRNAYGGTFGKLASLDKGDKIVVTTTQGQSVYTITSVRDREIVDRASRRNPEEISRDTLFGPTDDDRLTLVTSASRRPWNTSIATIAVAKIRDDPFVATQQGARTEAQTDLGGNSTSWAQVLLVLLCYAGGLALSVLVYRKMRFRTAYLLTIAPIAALTVITAETLSNLIPSWT